MKEFNKDTFNKLCAEFLGGSIYLEEGRWHVRNWNNSKHYPLEIISHCPSTMWGTKEETYNQIVKEKVASYGSWGKFDSDWNWIMEVVTKIHQQLKPDSSLKQDLIRRVGVVDKEKTVNTIWEFLNNISKYI